MENDKTTAMQSDKTTLPMMGYALGAILAVITLWEPTEKKRNQVLGSAIAIGLFAILLKTKTVNL